MTKIKHFATLLNLFFNEAFLLYIFGIFLLWQESLELTGSEVGEREGVGSGKVLEPGFELGTPIAQPRCMSAHCPQGYQSR